MHCKPFSATFSLLNFGGHFGKSGHQGFVPFIISKSPPEVSCSTLYSLNPLPIMTIVLFVHATYTYKFCMVNFLELCF